MASCVYKFGKCPELKRQPHVLDTRFFISYNNFRFVWEATKEWHHFSISRSGTLSHQIVSLFNQGFNFGVGVTRVQDSPKDDGDIVALWYKGLSPLVNRHRFFLQRIAKYVREGSYINLMKSDRREATYIVQGKEALEENTLFRQWYFNGDYMEEKKGKLIFERTRRDDHLEL